MAHDFDASTNVMQADLLRELTDRIRERRSADPPPDSDEGMVVELVAEEASPEEVGPRETVQPAPAPNATSARKAWPWAIAAVLAAAALAGFCGGRALTPLIVYVRAHRALTLPSPVVVEPPAPPPTAAIMIASDPPAAPPPAAVTIRGPAQPATPAAAPSTRGHHRSHAKHGRGHR